MRAGLGTWAAGKGGGLSSPYHPRPSEARLRKALRKVKEMLRKEPGGIDAASRIGWRDALEWVLGCNAPFDQKFKTRD